MPNGKRLDFDSLDNSATLNSRFAYHGESFTSAPSFHQYQAEALGDLITKTFSEVEVFNIYSSYVNNLAGLQKSFKQETETNQEFARFLKVSIPIICQGLTFNYAGDWQQFGIKFGLVFAQPEAGAKTSPAKDAVGATAEENSKRSP